MCILAGRTGRWAGYLFGWIQLAIVRPGDIAVIAFAFAMYARTIYDPFAGSLIPYSQRIYAGAAVAILTGINILGVKGGKWTQKYSYNSQSIGAAGYRRCGGRCATGFAGGGDF